MSEEMTPASWAGTRRSAGSPTGTSPDLSSVTAVFLASGRMKRKMQVLTGCVWRWQVRLLDGGTMLDRAVLAAHEAGIGNVIVIGHELPESPYFRAVIPKPDKDSRSGNIFLGIEESSTSHILYLPMDLPFLNGESIRSFLCQALGEGQPDFAMGVVPVKVCENFLSGMKQTWLPFSEGDFTAADIYLFNQETVLKNPRLIAFATTYRKIAPLLVLKARPSLLPRFILSRLGWKAKAPTLQEARIIGEKQLKARCAVVIGTPEISIDIDKPHRWEAYQNGRRA